MEKPWRDLSGFLLEKFGEKTDKVCIDGGFTCPNRDGRCGVGGCLFCSARGGGEFIKSPTLPVGEQMKRGAFIGVCDISIKQDTLDNIQGEIKMYDRLVEMVFGGDPV